MDAEGCGSAETKTHTEIIIDFLFKKTLRRAL